MINFSVIDRDGTRKEVEVPEDINLNLMEVLKASEYNILATCGGMALCATCRVEVESGLEQLQPAGDQELDMLDMLPDAATESRLACQLRVNQQLEGIVIRISGDLA
ncbi:ferredoxin [Pelobium manganitolerans]|uniref:Ferredoxin n=1 Tax=Pelobium manganitolerans TaxID=1842495 RepID=A0A419S9D3_9SPHI|nr:2Fe-2S iron-sulfur cluster-binding protein [Pelobium manganitolerans]RKD18636.1 ferredoxin [Pelobium manganitolerans]